jgi:peptidoglycan hydrolase-like protein with peptidoglycan-binding domain
MRKLILTTAAVLASGMAGAGIGHAGQPPVTSVTIAHGAYVPQGAVNQVLIEHGTQPRRGLPTKQAVNLSHRGIERVQRQLKARGLYNGPINGQMDLQTRQAIARFQKRHGLLQSGTADLQTLAALNGLTNGVGSTERPGAQPSQRQGDANGMAPNRAGR